MHDLLPAPGSARQVALAGPGAVVRRPRLATVFDFSCLEALTLLRLPLSLRAFQTAGLAATVVALLGLATVSWVGLGLLSASLQERPGQLAAVVAVALFANGYVGLAHLLGEVTTRRRYRLSNSPNVALFRALDLSAAAVFAVYAVLPTTLVLLLVLVVDAGLLVAFADRAGLGTGDALCLLAVPIAGYVLTLALQARAAARPARPGPGRGSAWWLCPLLLSVGWATGRWAVGPVLAGPGDAHVLEVQQLLRTAGGASLALTAVGLVLLHRAVRRLRHDSYVVRPQLPTRRASGHLLLARGLHRLPVPLPEALHREWLSSWAAPLVQKTLTGLLGVVCLGVGVRLSGAGLLPASEVPPALAFSAEIVTYALVLGVADVTLTHVGAVKLGAHLRFAWECGLSARTAALSMVGLFLAPALAVAGLVVVLSAVLLGETGTTPIAVAVTVLAASVLAESVVPPVRNTDGSAVPDALSAVVAVALSAPVLLLTYGQDEVLAALAHVYAVGLLGGAVACLERRIVLHR